MDYLLNEMTLKLPEVIQDRTVNVLLFGNANPPDFKLVISRDFLPKGKVLVRYQYSDEGDLVSVIDRHGLTQRRFTYQQHMMVSQEFSSGLQSHFTITEHIIGYHSKFKLYDMLTTAKRHLR
jgi:hypothetical protein